MDKQLKYALQAQEFFNTLRELMRPLPYGVRLDVLTKCLKITYSLASANCGKEAAESDFERACKNVKENAEREYVTVKKIIEH